MFWLLQQIMFSVFIIILIHYFYNYLKDTLTTPMIKNVSIHNNHLEDLKQESLDDSLVKKDNAIILDNAIVDNTISDNAISDNAISDNAISDNTISDNAISDNAISDNAEENEMKNMLKNYIKEISISSPNTLSTTDIKSLPQTN